MSSIGAVMPSTSGAQGPATGSRQARVNQAEEQRYAEWLVSQAMRREISLDERRWLDQYLWRSRSEGRTTRCQKGSVGPVVFCWVLAILASGAVALATWLS